jgi:hypothetical protein
MAEREGLLAAERTAYQQWIEELSALAREVQQSRSERSRKWGRMASPMRAGD